MFSTSITRTFKLTTPIVNAGMAMIARPALAAAVCEAGGLGSLGCATMPPDVAAQTIGELRRRTNKPINVNFLEVLEDLNHV